MTKEDDAWLWHKKLAHINMGQLNKLVSKDLFIGLPNIRYASERLCDTCQKGNRLASPSRTKGRCQLPNLYNFYTWTYLFPQG